MQYTIKNNIKNPSKIYNLIEEEEKFFNFLYSKLNIDENIRISLMRMSGGDLEVYFDSFYVGRVKLQGRKHWIQILTRAGSTKKYEGSLDTILPKVEMWVKYIRNHLNKANKI